MWYTRISRLDRQPTSRIVQDDMTMPNGSYSPPKSTSDMYSPKLGYYPEDAIDPEILSTETTTKSYLVQRISTLTQELNSLVSQLEKFK